MLILPEKKPIFITVAFDGNTESLCSTAITLGKIFDSPLHFVYAFSGLKQLLNRRKYSTPSEKALYTNSENEIRLKHQQMQNLIESIHECEVSGEVLRGSIGASICKRAKEKKARFILTDFNPNPYSPFLQGNSIALDLMSTSTIPVLAILKNSCIRIPEDRNFRLMICDDLEKGSLSAVEFAYQCALSIKNVEIFHVHMRGSFRDLIQTYCLHFAKKFSHFDIKLLEPQKLLQNHQKKIEKTLENRGADLTKKARELGIYIEKIVQFTADFRDDLTTASDQIAPDLVIFGRHKLFKIRPFILGRMPLQAMTEFDCPILIVPAQGVH